MPIILPRPSGCEPVSAALDELILKKSFDKARMAQDKGQRGAVGEVTGMSGTSAHTVCEEAGCPNCGECFGRKAAAFMILGRVCTRGCRFCCVEKGTPAAPDAGEPENVDRAVEILELGHVVITSVTRDDLPDGGAAHFAAVTGAIRRRMSGNPPRIGACPRF